MGKQKLNKHNSKTYNRPDGVVVREKIQSRRRKVSGRSVISYSYREGLTDRVLFEQKLKESEGSKH